MSRVRTRRDGRPTLIRGPVGPPPRSGIWKAKVRTSKFGVDEARCSGPEILGPTDATYSGFTQFPFWGPFKARY
ncbi:hypothetical protein GCM10023324_58890 [Streptomyces youssoufiensis]